MIEARSDVVGSLLRTPRLLEAREAFATGSLSTAELKAAEDEAVDAALRLQKDAGVDVVTDGEMRRLSFQSQLPAAVEGFSAWDLDAFLWGEWHGDAEIGEMKVARPELAVVGKLRRRRSLCAEEFAYARGHTDRVLKVTLPSPSLFANFWDPRRAPSVYRTLEDFLTDVAEILREEADELEAMGATYLQLDAPHYTMVLDPSYRDFYASRGWPTEQWLDLGIELDNRVIGDRPGVTFGFHLCRGNQASRWLVEGGYDAVAEQIFGGIGAHRLLLEYDDPRSGSFEPLARVPDDRWVVLGLVTTKRPDLESVDDLARRIDAASRYVPLERLAISSHAGSRPRCSATRSRSMTSGRSSESSLPRPARYGADAGQYWCVPYDPTIYQGSARYYAQGRPPYSRELVSTLTHEIGLDGSGRLLDVGCGPGILTVELAPSFHEAIGLDPDADMLAEGERRARAAGVDSIRWIEAVADAIPTLRLGPCRLVTFGQSFQWTDRERVAEAVYDILEPGGALALIGNTVEGRPEPQGPGYPPIPHDEIHALIRRYLGPRRRAGQGFRSDPPDRHEDVLARTRFGTSHAVFAPGRPDIVRDTDGVLAGFLSMSFAAPHLFGDQRDAFEADVRALLKARSPRGLFWDWPGDTEILLARKPAQGGSGSSGGTRSQLPGSPTTFQPK